MRAVLDFFACVIIAEFGFAPDDHRLPFGSWGAENRMSSNPGRIVGIAIGLTLPFLGAIVISRFPAYAALFQDCNQF